MNIFQENNVVNIQKEDVYLKNEVYHPKSLEKNIIVKVNLQIKSKISEIEKTCNGIRNFVVLNILFIDFRNIRHENGLLFTNSFIFWM